MASEQIIALLAPKEKTFTIVATEQNSSSVATKEVFSSSGIRGTFY